MNPLIERMAARTGFSKKACGLAVAHFADDMTYLLGMTGECRIPGFGTLKVTERPARKGRNPATGEVIDIPAKRVITFRPAKALKDAIG